jgi:serine/threonine-protein kinase HipA
MENLIVDVKLWGQFVGSLIWDNSTEMAVFEYDSQYRRNGLELAPLTMPLTHGSRPFSFPANRTDCFKGLPGLIADALPDKFGNQIITEWFTRQGLAAEVRRCYLF